MARSALACLGIMATLYVMLVVAAATAEVEEEVKVLMEVKEALDPNGKILESWKRQGHPCGHSSFEGVACNKLGKVANVSLQGKGLSGVIPAALGRLSSLTGLYLHYNNLHGRIPSELSNLTQLLDLYLNVNSVSGPIPKQLGFMPSLQTLQLCCNSLTGPIPRELGSLSKLSVLALQHNSLSGAIPATLGGLVSLTRLDLSFNLLVGPIPLTIARLPRLTLLDISNTNVSGKAPQRLKQMRRGFLYGNNSKLCGKGFSGLRACNSSVLRPEPLGSETPPILNSDNGDANTNGRSQNGSASPGPAGDLPESAELSRTGVYSKGSPRYGIAIILGVVVLICGGVMASISSFLWFRRRKQKISTSYETSDSRPSVDIMKDMHKQGIIPFNVVTMDYSSGGWQNSRFNLEVIESATQHFSDKNLLGKNEYCATYKGVLRDGSFVAVKRISRSSCKTEDVELQESLKSLYLLRHENVLRLRGFCCSKGRGECFLVYDFLPNGNLLHHLDVADGTDGRNILDWPSRVKIAHGIAKGIEYLHEGRSKPMVHHNISAKKILLDKDMKPMLADCGLEKLLAEDMVYSIVKASASMGYLAPEYSSLRARATEKSDIYAFGVIILQLLTGTSRAIVRPLVRMRVQEMIDVNLGKDYSKVEASNLFQIAVECTHEVASQRPSISAVLQQFESISLEVQNP